MDRNNRKIRFILFKAPLSVTPTSSFAQKDALRMTWGVTFKLQFKKYIPICNDLQNGGKCCTLCVHFLDDLLSSISPIWFNFKGYRMKKQELHPRTAVINKKQKNLSKKSRLEALNWLAATFPNAFDNTIHIQPLSLGIMNDILAYADKAAEAGISKSKLRESVVLFARRIDYLTCLKAREMRVDLNGNPVAQVTEEEALLAAAKIKKRVEKTAKNARKNLITTPSVKPPISRQMNTSSQEFTPYYPERAPAYSVQNSTAPAARVASVTVTHKQTRQYDPDAVARLKAKLGLSRKKDAETV